MVTHAAVLTLFARTWCRSPEDAVQEAFCRLYRIVSEPSDPVAWLFTVVRRLAIDMGKSDRRRSARESLAVRWFAESEVDGLDAADAVRALEQLDREQREVIVARLWGQLTFEQIAASCGTSVSTAHRRYEAGLAAIREQLGESCPTTS
jgi:RNA polymerase sigma-70 factor (ECF subfamily)